MISLDTETTGTDRWHGARPYLFTFCNEQFENVHYEFEVEPRTRRVVYNRPDLEEIAHSILSASILVLQNPKFDVSMVLAAMGDMDIVIEWPWHNTRDTLMAGHLLASNHAHDLASMAIEYLAVDIQAYEDVLKKAVSNCRNIVRCKDSPIGDWRIARAGLPEMPSAGGKMWKYDTWLPRAVAKRKIPEHERSWLTVASTYANSDSATTLALYKQQLELIRHRGLEAIYLQRLKLLPVVTDMESYGITANQKRLAELYQEYTTESQRANRLCCNIATSCNYELALPKSGTNKSLTTFVFDTLRLPVLKRGPKTGNPSMDKRVLEQYLDILPPNSKSLKFVGTLIDKRKRDTAISYMDGYKRFWLSTDHGMWGILHPNLNPTGSDTLRFSSNHPNEQNISKQEGFNLRYIFGPAPGREWWSLDAKNIELRIPAYEANEQELIDLFERGDEPPYYGSEHLLNFSTVYPDIWGKELEIVGFDKVGPHCKKKYASSWYQWCKNGGFAVGYGAVERPDGKGTADKAFHRAGSHALLKERFSKKEKLNQYYIEMANEFGYVETLPDKTVDPEHGYPLLCSRSQWGGIKPTVPLNYHVQGSAMWWMCQAMIKCAAQLAEWSAGNVVDAHLVMQVHDEIVFDFPKAENMGNLSLVKKLVSLMESCGNDIGIPTPVGIEYNEETWSEGVTI